MDNQQKRKRRVEPTHPLPMNNQVVRVETVDT